MIQHAVPQTSARRLTGFDGAVERALTEHFRGRRRVTRVRHRPFVYRSTLPLREVEAELDDGRSLRLIAKRLGRSVDARVLTVKPEFLRDTQREAGVYRNVLAHGGLDTPAVFGIWQDLDGGCWLLLERVDAVPLWQTDDTRTWCRVAAWLGEMHARFAPAATALGAEGSVRLVDDDYLAVWLERARVFHASGAHAARADWLFHRIERLRPTLPERVLSLPRTFIHGEFYPANILVGAEPPVRVCPVDWEMAAVGPGLLDLAALVTGWDDPYARMLTREYVAALERGGVRPPGAAELDLGLWSCRLQLAVQWLGWSREWRPPAEQARDWMAEAERALRELEA